MLTVLLITDRLEMYAYIINLLYPFSSDRDRLHILYLRLKIFNSKMHYLDSDNSVECVFSGNCVR